MKIILLVCLIAIAAVFANLGMDQPKYPPNTVSARAESLIGHMYEEYACNQLANYANYGDKFYKGYLAHHYLEFGQTSSQIRTGCAIAARDGSHVGLITSDGMFIHSSSPGKPISKRNIKDLPYIFPSGYRIGCF